MADLTTTLPAGTVTFMFTDVEGSTPLAEQHPGDYPRYIAENRAAISGAVTGEDGVVVSTEGDEVFASFARSASALRAALAAQERLLALRGPGGAPAKVRIGLHAGQGVVAGSGYVGVDVHRAARVANAAHGGQVLLSGTASQLARPDLPEGVALRNLGVHRLRGLGRPEPLFELQAPGLPSGFPPPRAAGVTPHNLPTRLTSFVGRAEAKTQLMGLIRSQRLVTLTGPGGIGKTRLSIEVAEELLGDFPDGVTFVPLASVRDPELVLPAIVSALGVPLALEPLRSLAGFLSGRSVLIVLDNLEQVAGAAPYIADLLQAAPETRILATSRSPLLIAGEREFPVQPLDTSDAPAGESAAVQLLADRMAAIRPGFALDPENAPVLAEIALRLDGLPLAIELAAARSRVLNPGALLERLGDRLSLLRAGPLDLPARQQTLADTIAWSYELLGDAARKLFERLGVFRGGASLEMVEAVAGPDGELGGSVLDALGLLVDQSLVQQQESEAEPRFRMLESIRQYAAARLLEAGAADEIARRYAAAYLQLAESAVGHQTSREQRRWLDRLDVEHANLRSALDWFLLHDRDGAARLAAALWRFWQFRGYLHEARERLAAVLEGPIRSPETRASALTAAGGVAYWQGDLVEARRHYDAALSIRRELGDRGGVADALYDLAFGYGPAGELDTANALLAEALQLAEGHGDRHRIARVLFAFHGMAVANGEWDEAEKYGEKSTRLFRELGDEVGLGWLLFDRGGGALAKSPPDPTRARHLLEESLAIFTELGDPSALTLHLVAFAGLVSFEGDHLGAARLAGASARIQRASGADLVEVTVRHIRRLDASVEALGDEVFRAAFAEGELMDLDEALDHARRGH